MTMSALPMSVHGEVLHHGLVAKAEPNWHKLHMGGRTLKVERVHESAGK